MSQKNAYPNIAFSVTTAGYTYDVEKWKVALRDIYYRMRVGTDRSESIRIVTNGWHEKEIRDFMKWIRFYEENNHMKYKTANYYEGEDSTGYFLPYQKEKPIIPDPIVTTPDPTALKQEAERNKVSEEEKRIQIENHRRKIVGRIHAARKLLTDDKGKMFAGPGWEKLLDALNDLEKQIHTVNKSARNDFYCDLILRQANRLERSGANTAIVLKRMAQALGPGSIPDPSASIPQGGGMENNNPSLDPNDAPKDSEEGIKKVLDAFNGEYFDDSEVDDSDVDDSDVEVDESDESDESEIEVNESDETTGIDPFDIYAGLVVMAQEAQTTPVQPAGPTAPVSAPTKQPILPLKDKKLIPDDSTSETTKDFDSLIGMAFSNLKVQDIINRLDELSRIFKNREIAKQLSIVDMMMDKLGLSSFFPSMAEATRSALESNQYCLVRIDEVKSRLSGAVDATGTSLHDMGQEHSIRNQQNMIDLTGKDVDSKDPLLNKVKENLETEEAKAKMKKELRRQQQEENLLENKKETPVVENVQEDLMNMPTPAPAPKTTIPASPAPAPNPAIPPAPATPKPDGRTG